MENVQTKWVVDPNHSKVAFKVKHLAIANVAGTFKVFGGNVQTATEDFENAVIAFELDAASIDTNLEVRDNHLRSDIFLDVVKFPKITFNGVLAKKAGDYEVDGELTIRDVTRNIKLPAVFNGIGRDNTPLKNTRAGFEASGKINRKDFGVTFNMLTDTGGLTIGEEIMLQFDIELIKQVATNA